MVDRSDAGDDGQFCELMAAARRGDRGAWGVVLQGFRGHLLITARRRLNGDLRSKSDPSDLVQQTFLEAVAPPERGNSPAEVRAWLTRMLENNVRDFVARYRQAHVRRIDREVSLNELAMQPVARADGRGHGVLAAGIETREAAEALEVAMGALPIECRRVVVWRQIDGLRFAQIGRHLGISENAARKMWLRSLTRLRREMSPLHAPD